MSRPPALVFSITFAACTVLMSGCKTTYSDMYSPRRSHFVPKKEKPAATSIPLEDTNPSRPVDTTGGAPGLGLPTSAPDAGAMPAIPGL